MLPIEIISELVKDVPDFPKPGIVFKDITPVLENHEAFISVARHFVKALPQGTTHLVGIESRGFIFASAVCQHLDAGLVLVRKPGKLPRDTHEVSYELEYGSDRLQIHKDALKPGDKVVIIDDVLATGGTAAATAELVLKTGAEILGLHFFMEIAPLNGASKLKFPVKSHIVIN